MLFRSDRKSTRLNSSHTIISYAVFCLKKKNVLRSEEHTSELQSHDNLVCRLLLEENTGDTARPGGAVGDGGQNRQQGCARQCAVAAHGLVLDCFFFLDGCATRACPPFSPQPVSQQ